jgi:hypothetical protein
VVIRKIDAHPHWSFLKGDKIRQLLWQWTSQPLIAEIAALAMYSHHTRVSSCCTDGAVLVFYGDRLLVIVKAGKVAVGERGAHRFIICPLLVLHWICVVQQVQRLSRVQLSVRGEPSTKASRQSSST